MPFQLTPHTDINVSSTFQVDVLDSSRDTYPSLSWSEQRKVAFALTTTYPDAGNVLYRTRQWKSNNGNSLASRHEKTFKRALNISAKVRNGPISWEPSKTAQSTAETLHELSEEVLRQKLGDEFTIYRGLSFECPYLLKKVLESPPSTTSYHVKPSVFSNYSTSKTGAASFCPLIVTKEDMTPSDVGLAANYIFTYRNAWRGDLTNGNGIVSPNAELRVFGDNEQPHHEDELSVIIGDPSTPSKWSESSLKDFLNQCPNFNMNEHDIMRELVESMVGRVKIADQDAQDLLNDWRNNYLQTTGIDVQDTIDRLIP